MKKTINLFLIPVLFLFVLVDYNGLNCYGKADDIVYKNNKFNYTLKFPVSWRGNYIVNENNEEGYIEVCFIGKSNVSKNYNQETNKAEGLSMFFVSTERYLKENEFTDGAMKIGKSHHVNFYYFTNTDYPLGALFDTYKSSTINKKERDLAHNDFIKATKMEKDIKDILKTFRGI